MFGMLLGGLLGCVLVLASVRTFYGYGLRGQQRFLPIAGGILGGSLLLGAPLALGLGRYNGGLAGGVTAGFTVLLWLIAGVVMYTSVIAYKENNPRAVVMLFAILSGFWWFYVFQLDAQILSTYQLELTLLWILLVGGSIYIARKWPTKRTLKA